VLPKVIVTTTAWPLAMVPDGPFSVTTLSEQATAEPVKLVQAVEIWKPAFVEIPWMSREPGVTATEPTFRRIMVAVLPEPSVKVAESIDTLD